MRAAGGAGWAGLSWGWGAGPGQCSYLFGPGLCSTARGPGVGSLGPGGRGGCGIGSRDWDARPGGCGTGVRGAGSRARIAGCAGPVRGLGKLAAEPAGGFGLMVGGAQRLSGGAGPRRPAPHPGPAAQALSPAAQLRRSAPPLNPAACEAGGEGLGAGLECAWLEWMRGGDAGAG